MRPIQGVATRLRRLVGSAKARPIPDRLARFDSPEFLAKTESLADPWLREHALNVLKDGYTVIENAVPEKIVDVALTTFFEWKERNRQRFLPEFYKQGCFLDRVVNFQNVFDEFKALFACNQSLVLQDYLFGSPATCYTSLFFEAATQQAIHRDITYFWTCPAYMYFGMWTALEEVTLENGPLTVVPGSHRIGDIDRSRIVQDKYSRKSVPRRDRDLAVEYQRLVLERCDDMGLQPKQLPVPKGATIVWHPLLAHGGAAVLDLQKSRLSFVVHTTPKHVPVYQHDVFFQPDKPVAKRAAWPYSDYAGRSIAQTGGLSIGHKMPDYDFLSLV
jgi:ectoine hydroxylase-related dioxygenase (phytanoyl-CoA dioxygenase family)